MSRRSILAYLPKSIYKIKSKGSKNILSLFKPRHFEKVITKTLDYAVDATTVMPYMQKSRFSQYVDELFEHADTNKDGHVYFAEVYELVLKLYIYINRQAPIPPPSKEEVIILYLEADKTQNNRLTKEEFSDLAHAVGMFFIKFIEKSIKCTTKGQRAMSRLLANRVLTLIGAPLLAEAIVRALSNKDWMLNMAKFIIPNKYRDYLLPTITSKAFCRTILIIFLVESLGDIILHIVDWAFDKKKDQNEHPRLKSFIGHYYLSNNMNTNYRSS